MIGHTERDAGIASTLVELETSLNDRWNRGDCNGYLDNYHDDITYFDPMLERQLVGRTAVLAHILPIYRDPRIVRSAYLDPQVVVSENGDLAVLSYNLENYVADGAGGESLLRAWNSTEVYKMTGGDWRIIHSHWALTQSVTDVVS